MDVGVGKVKKLRGKGLYINLCMPSGVFLVMVRERNNKLVYVVLTYMMLCLALLSKSKRSRYN